MSRASLQYSPLTGHVYWGRVSGKGIAIGEQRDVTSEFLQVMEMKFPVNTTQLIAVNGVNKYRVLAVDLTKRVVVKGKVTQEGDNPPTLYTCEGKGGVYEFIGITTGAGRSRDLRVAVYRDTSSGMLFHRDVPDFEARMRPLPLAANSEHSETGD